MRRRATHGRINPRWCIFYAPNNFREYINALKNSNDSTTCWLQNNYKCCGYNQVKLVTDYDYDNC